MGRSRNSPNPIRALAAEYNFMRESDSNKYIAQMTLKNIKQIPNLTVERAAEMCNVSTSTYHRFCRGMGYESYSDFKFKISAALENYTYSQEHVPGIHEQAETAYIDNLTDAIKLDLDILKSELNHQSCENAAKLLLGAERVFIHNQIYSTMRLILQSDLAVCGKLVQFSPDTQQQLADIEVMGADSVVVVIIDQTRRGVDVLRSIPSIADTGAKIIAISESRQFKGSELCDELIVTGAGTTAISAGMLSDIVFLYISAILRREMGL